MKRKSFKSLSVSLAVFMTAIMAFSAMVNAATPTGERLKNVQSRVMVGTAFPSGFTTMSDSPATLKIAAAEFNVVSPQNFMTWEATEPTQNNFIFSEGDKLVNWAMANRFNVHGRTLVWNKQTPNWVMNLNASAMESAMYNHIDKVMKHYRGKIAIWDVVNEAMEDDGRYKNSFLYVTMGKNFIEKAFIRARAADPDAKLIYNDYNLEYTGIKSNGAYNMLKDLKSRGIPVDGVGFQMRIDTRYAIDYNDFAKNMQRFADLGLDIYITEMAVRVPGSSSADYETQARYYKNIVEKCMEQPAVKAIQLWNFADQYPYMPWAPEPIDNSYIFDKNLNPKPSYYAMQAALDTFTPDRYGDVDGNGSVDAIDLSLMKKYLLGSITTFPSTEGMKAADLNASGTVDVLDFALLKKHLLSIITKFPAE